MTKQKSFDGIVNPKSCPHTKTDIVKLPDSMHYAQEVCQACGKRLRHLPKPKNTQSTTKDFPTNQNERIPNFDNELDFTEKLANYLKTCQLITNPQQNRTSNYSKIEVAHQKTQATGYRPDITIDIKKGPLQLFHNNHILSSPFFIEAKHSPRKIQHNLHQFLGYKYDGHLHTIDSLVKYEGNYVLATAPQLLKDNRKHRSTETDGWFSIFQLIRTLWGLGLGVLLVDRGHLIGAFNEQDEIEFVSY